MGHVGCVIVLSLLNVVLHVLQSCRLETMSSGGFPETFGSVPLHPALTSKMSSRRPTLPQLSCGRVARLRLTSTSIAYRQPRHYSQFRARRPPRFGLCRTVGDSVQSFHTIPPYNPFPYGTLSLSHLVIPSFHTAACHSFLPVPGGRGDLRKYRIVSLSGVCFPQGGE